MPPELNTICQMDALQYLRQCKPDSVNCMITSPPYWGLRDYGVDGQVGLEPTLPEYIAGLVAIFHEARRVLRPDGVLWLNMGDSYAATTKGNNNGTGKSTLKDGRGGCDYDASVNSPPRKMRLGNLKPKDLIGQPWRLALALQDDGWWLRSDIIWSKPNPMPESVTDRVTVAHEYVFMLTKSARYWYDADAIREEAMPASYKRLQTSLNAKSPHDGLVGSHIMNRDGAYNLNPAGRNKRSVWTVATQPMKLAHFAAFPEKLIEPMILAGCPKGGVVLDMFMGSGTVALVAQKNGRNWAGCELNPEYIEIAMARLQGREKEYIAGKNDEPHTVHMFEGDNNG